MLKFILTHGAFWVVTDGCATQFLHDHEAEHFMAELHANNVTFEILAA